MNATVSGISAPRGRGVRFFVSLILALLFIISAIAWIVGEQPRLRFEVLKPGATEFESITIPLTDGEPSAPVLQAETAGVHAIQNVSLTYLFHRRQWLSNQLPKFFSRQSGIQQARSRRKMFNFRAAQAGASLNPSPEFFNETRELAKSKNYYYVLALAAALLLFFLIRHLHPPQLLFLLKTRALINMVFPFLAIILFFILNFWFNFLPGKTISERRPIAKKTEFRPEKIFQFARPFTSYHADHFPLRGSMIYLNNLVQFRLFNQSGMKQVLLGKDGWLFLNNMEKKAGTVEYFRNTSLLTLEELEHWRLRLEERHDWLAARGIRYLFVLAPNKNTIYPEYMPDRFRKARDVSRMDQLLTHLRVHSRVAVLDLRPTLLAAKKDQILYYQTDTHWNDYGAFLAYRDIMAYLAAHFSEFQSAPVLSLKEFQIIRQDQAGGDLAEMLFLSETVIRENWLRMEPLKPFTFTGDALPDLPTASRHGYTSQPGAPLPVMVMVHDSFCKKWRPYFSQMFSRVVYIWDWGTHFYPNVIEREKPAIVIDEMVERFLMDKKLTNPSGVMTPEAQ